MVTCSLCYYILSSLNNLFGTIIALVCCCAVKNPTNKQILQKKKSRICKSIIHNTCPQKKQRHYQFQLTRNTLQSCHITGSSIASTLIVLLVTSALLGEVSRFHLQGFFPSEFSFSLRKFHTP